jgi:hypothetical protein
MIAGPVLAALLAAAPSYASPRYATVDVESKVEGDTGSVIERRINERAALLLNEATILPARGEQDATIMVLVTPGDGDEPGYTYEIRTEHGPKTIAPVEGGCTLCTEGELVAKVENDLREVVSFLPTPAPPPSAAPAPLGSDPTTTDRRRLGSKGIAGTTLLVGGGIALVTGIGLAVAPPRTDPNDPKYERVTQPAGFAVLGVGAATVVVGAVLLGLDRRERRTRAAQLGPSSIRVRF